MMSWDLGVKRKLNLFAIDVDIMLLAHVLYAVLSLKCQKPKAYVTVVSNKVAIAIRSS